MNPADNTAGARRARRPGWILLTVLLLAAVAAFFGWRAWSERTDAPAYRTAKVVRGPITAAVSASGALNPVTSVQVGSQVSGQLKEVLADFNSEVRRGQVIARIDPETFEYRVRQSQADLDASRAQVMTAQANISAAQASVSRAGVNEAEARRDLERKQMLLERNFIYESEVDKARAVFNASVEDTRSATAQLAVAQAQARTAEATVRQREAQLQQARIDLERTAIRAPVDGVVIKRSVDAGQTVAASLQAPELFIIARNLRDMQVDAAIDEAEIGRIRPGQQATFTVDSFPGRTFSGEVRQVRKAATTVQNVVTYVVVVSAQNPDLALVPGMTANVRITTDTRDSVLKVPNAALRFRPPDWQEPPRQDAPAKAAAAADATPAVAAVRAALDRASALLPSAHAQAGGGGTQGGGAMARFRERIDRELAPTEAQKRQLDDIFASMRTKFAAVREAPEGERGKLIERHRAELRARINDILTPEQQKKYAEILAEIGGRQATRGRVFVLGPDGAPKAVSVRTGLTDGSATEVSSDALKEGDEVLIGLAGPPKTARPAAGGPRMPF